MFVYVQPAGNDWVVCVNGEEKTFQLKEAALGYAFSLATEKGWSVELREDVGAETQYIFKKRSLKKEQKQPHRPEIQNDPNRWN